MTMTPEKSKPLHNISLPNLKWGNRSRRFLRCMKLTSNSESLPLKRRSLDSESKPYTRIRQSRSVNPKSSEPTSIYSPSRPIDGLRIPAHQEEDERIEAVRKKLTFNLRMAAERMRVSVLDEVVEEDESGTAAAARPWNLRTRRSACTAPSNEEKKKGESNKPLMGEHCRGEKNERAEFSIALSRDEVGDDFAAMMGKKPSRRPKKRPKIVQKHLDSIFPGLWLTEITVDSFKVPELPESGTGKVL